MSSLYILTPEAHCPCAQHWHETAHHGLEFSVDNDMFLTVEFLESLHGVKAGQRFYVSGGGLNRGLNLLDAKTVAREIWRGHFYIHIAPYMKSFHHGRMPTTFEPARLP